MDATFKVFAEAIEETSTRYSVMETDGGK
jgi:hypothetical protein